uniref:Uncharacterized protein n=1 Tax=Moorena producens (strain JHB) TaxID=1454205 RepID=A0A1D9G7K5_MOOP1
MRDATQNHRKAVKKTPAPTMPFPGTHHMNGSTVTTCIIGMAQGFSIPLLLHYRSLVGQLPESN